MIRHLYRKKSAPANKHLSDQISFCAKVRELAKAQKSGKVKGIIGA